MMSPSSTSVTAAAEAPRQRRPTRRRRRRLQPSFKMLVALLGFLLSTYLASTVLLVRRAHHRLNLREGHYGYEAAGAGGGADLTKATTKFSNKENVAVSDADHPAAVPNEKKVTEDEDRNSSSAHHDGNNKPSSSSSSYLSPNIDLLLPRVLAFVFPQFHKDPLNDRLWGDNFTDWDNLRGAPAKNRLGYRIPRPDAAGRLGYYDYTQRRARKEQGELAEQHGIDGFVYHHYWFYDDDHPGPNLHAPLEEMLKDGYPDIPFALHWCASKWTNTWSGKKVSPNFVYREPGVLQKQYFPANATHDVKVEHHYNWLRRFFRHPRYIKVNGGRPLFMVYQKKPSSFPVLRRLRQLAIADEFPGLHITLGLTMPHSHLQVIPDASRYSREQLQNTNRVPWSVFDQVVAYPNPTEWNEKRPLEIPSWCSADAMSGENTQKKNEAKRVKEIAGIISSFDNTPRRNYEEAHLWSADEPQNVVKQFHRSVVSALYYESCCFHQQEMGDKKQRTTTRDGRGSNIDDGDRFILINAMNEWAEGMAMEPSDVYGRKFLEAVRDAKASVMSSLCNDTKLIL